MIRLFYIIMVFAITVHQLYAMEQQSNEQSPRQLPAPLVAKLQKRSDSQKEILRYIKRCNQLSTQEITLANERRDSDSKN